MAGEEDIAALDDALLQAGEDVVLRRSVGAGNQAKTPVNVRACVRGYQPHELIGPITQLDLKLILSPTQLVAAQWPGGAAPTQAPFNPHPNLPKVNDDAIVQGRLRNVEQVNAFFVEGALVRIELRVRG